MSKGTEQTRRRSLPLLLLAIMAGAWLLLWAVLPLYGLFFHTALLAEFGQWILLPTRLLFSGQRLTPTLAGVADGPPPPPALSWQQTGLLLASFLLLLIVYLLALRFLPGRAGHRFIIFSTVLPGLICIIIPVVTSQDIYSYIIYARMGVFYHLNPLTTSPQAIQGDPTYIHLYWKDQPSAYGPVWIWLTEGLQWLVGLTGLSDRENIALMVLLLRLCGLVAHLCSVWLIWSISQKLSSPAITPRLRMLAVLAFAWNPLLLFEACINAHNDATLLFFVLLALWLLVRRSPDPATMSDYTGATVMLALASCIKVNVVLLFPGLLLLLWTRHKRFYLPGLQLATYAGIIAVLYMPFWQQGALLDILRINPGTSRNINTLPEFLSQLYNGVMPLLGLPGGTEIGSPAEKLLHTASQALFVVLYAALLLRTLLPSYHLNSYERLVSWMASAWLLYCALGAPWFWPWYAVTFFGMFALVVAIKSTSRQKPEPAQSERDLQVLLTTSFFAFSLLSLYCFYTWAPFVSFMPGLSHFRWAFLRGLWVWLLPLLAFLPRLASRILNQTNHG
ncbi:MAG: hypothetical protein IMW89_02930 [Ktedonobacteraceae bacterium]|nr:hypothetical protein [Ktedonobacteraceae bacterium]